MITLWIRLQYLGPSCPLDSCANAFRKISQVQWKHRAKLKRQNSGGAIFVEGAPACTSGFASSSWKASSYNEHAYLF